MTSGPDDGCVLPCLARAESSRCMSPDGGVGITNELAVSRNSISGNVICIQDPSHIHLSSSPYIFCVFSFSVGEGFFKKREGTQTSWGNQTNTAQAPATVVADGTSPVRRSTTGPSRGTRTRNTRSTTTRTPTRSVRGTTRRSESTEGRAIWVTAPDTAGMAQTGPRAASVRGASPGNMGLGGTKKVKVGVSVRMSRRMATPAL